MPRPSSPAEVRAYYAPTDVLSSEPARLTRAITWLGDGGRTRFDRYRHDVDRHMFLLGRVMARALVGRAAGLDPATWRWREGPRGRPEVGEPDVDIRFNVAHSAGMVVCVLAHGREVGADVEDRTRRPLDQQIVERYCSPAEVADIMGHGPAWHDRFLTYWTLKEAYLKARGLGIAVHLADLELTVDGDAATLGFRDSLVGSDPQWAFRLASPTPRYVMALAASSAAGPVSFSLAPLPVDWLP